MKLFHFQQAVPACKRTIVRIVPFISTLIISIKSRAQAADGAAGIKQATNMVQGYFGVATTLMYAIGGVVGIIGAVKVYNAWSHGDQQTTKLAASWFAACIFLVVVAAVLKSFFAIP